MKAALENLEAIPAKNKIAILGDMFEVGNTSAEEHQIIIDLLEKLEFSNMMVCGKNFYQTSTQEVSKFENFEDLKNYIQRNNFEDATILIKGSRGMALERILEAL